MGMVGGLLGLNGGVNGTGIQGPQMANIQNPTNQGQINAAYSGTQNSLQQQQALLNALQGQNGIQNQSNVYNQLQGVVSGQGPNPAQAMLANTTGQNVANQAALMAGQRGAGANVGLMARQAAQQGGALQQEAAGQGAALQANQSLNALGMAGNMAGNQVSNQMAATGANTQAQQAEQQALMNAQQAYNTQQVQQQVGVNNNNASMAGNVMGGQQSMVGGLLGGVGSLFGLKHAEGGMIEGPQSSFGRFMNGMAPAMNSVNMNQNGKVNPLTAGMSQFVQGLGGSMMPSTPAPEIGGMNKLMPMAAHGGKVPALVSPGEGYLTPEKAKKVVKGGKNPLKEAEIIPGKPKYAGNDYRNDVVPKKLKEGGVVIPNNIMQSSDPVGNAAKFVAATLAKGKQGMRK